MANATIPIIGGIEAATARVELAPEIVPLLSAQLYQSPLKAIEELVVNSYDADARNCYVSIKSKTIAVVDDGIGMDLGALKNLWNVGRSGKRNDKGYLKLVKRTQIGKFGIGKLAAYAIAESISYYTRSGSDILHATLNFAQFEAGAREVDVVIYQVAYDDAKAAEIVDSLGDFSSVPKELFRGKSWTVCLLTQLRPKAEQLSIGRLSWVLSTAMPIVDDFTLYLQGVEVSSAKLQQSPVASFDAKGLPKERYETLAKTLKTKVEVVDDRVITTALESGVRFKADIYPNTISTGKSVDLLRSHGFFVKVRGRLINEGDELFGLTALSYKYWNRFRGVFYVDDLDKELTASREGVEESTAVADLRELAATVFYEARARYDEWEKSQYQAERAKKEVGRNPVSPRLVEIPIADTVSRFGTENSGADADSGWFYVSFKGENEADLLTTLYGPREGVYSYRYESMGVNERLVKFHPAEKLFILNENHPLVREYKDENGGSQRLLQDFVTAEALLEVYLREAGVPLRIIGELLEQRDKLIRSLAKDQIYSLTSLADELRKASDQQYDLEISLVAASRALGFIAKHIGGAGMPDGIARFINNNSVETLITLEAKSSTDIPSLQAIDFGGIAEHMKNEGAAGALVIAPGYPGSSKSDDASAAKRAIDVRCSCWTVENLASVVAAAESREISAQDILDIVLNCFAPGDVEVAVKKLLSEPQVAQTELYADVVNAMENLVGRQLQKPLNVDMVLTVVSNSRKVTADQVTNAIRVVAKASKGLMRLRQDGSEIVLLGSFEELRRRLSGMISAQTAGRQRGSFRKATERED